MKLSHSEFWILAGIFSAIGGLGVWEGNELHPFFFSQSAIIFGAVGYFAYQSFYFDRKMVNGNGLRF